MFARRDVHRRRVFLAAATALAVATCATVPIAARCRAAEDEPVVEADAGAEQAVVLPTDRVKERQFAQLGRLYADARWSDAAAVCDELLAAAEDVFVREPAAATQRSLKAAVADLLARQPPRAREAYDMLFAARAERALAAALAADDRDGVAAVARRWLPTPAGRQAAAILAVAAVETGQPAVATAWLERLAAAGADDGLRPTLERLLARSRRRDAARAASAGWMQAGGDAARNAVVAASRPLLAARYRVPLARDAATAAGLERVRRSRRDRGADAWPAATPLVVAGTIFARAADGLVAIDLETGKRLWMRPRRGQTSGAAREPSALDAIATAVFDDAVGAGLTAAAGMVVAVEPVGREGGAESAASVLAAYDAASGADRWRLPADRSTAWILGPPLAVGDELVVIVEEKGEMRLDAVAAETGAIVWSQTLAELDDVSDASAAVGRNRRRAGLTPALADGILVCPLGAGAIVAVDMATRTLLWAFHDAPPDADEPPADVVGGLPAVVRSDARRRRDGWPVIAAGRVLLTPPDGDRLVCLDLRSGKPAWPEPLGGAPRIAGVTDEIVIVIGRSAIEGRALADGTHRWRLGHDEAGGRPTGRGILTASSLLMPLDSGAVVEIAADTGSVRGRSPARDGVVPGNLVAWRDAIVAQGATTLDVFHQAEPLEARVAATLANEPRSAWALAWRGQLALDRGDVAAGLAGLRAAALVLDAPRLPGSLAAAVRTGLDLDFVAAAPAWREVWQAETAAGSPAPPAARGMVRAAVDGFLDRRDATAAWEGCRTLLAAAIDVVPDELLPDPRDPALVVTADRWLAGRLARVRELAAEPLRRDLDAATLAAVDAAARAGTASLSGLERLATVLGRLPVAAEARQRIVAAIDAAIATGGDPAGRLAGRREAHLLYLLRHGDDAARTAAAARLAAAAGAVPAAGEWPLGRVIVRRARDPAAEDRGFTVAHRAPAPLTVDHPFRPGLAIAHDPQHGSLLVLDDQGRRLIEPLAIEAAQATLGLGWPAATVGPEASCLGRLLVVDGGSAVSAHDLAAAGTAGRCLWSRPRTSLTAREPAAGLVRRLGGEPEDGGVPLAGLLAEATGPPTARRSRGTVAHVSGVLHLDGRSLVLLDPTTGRVLWERRRLPANAVVFGDDAVACVAAADDTPALVVSLDDGRLVRSVRLPPARLRLGTAGRWLVAVAPADAGAARLEMLDPVTDARVALGAVDARSRVVLDGSRLVALDPTGGLTAFDLDRRGEAFRVRLPEMPAAFDYLHVVPQPGRLLVVAGDAADGDGSAAQDGADFFTARPWQSSAETSRPLVAAVWALDDSTGDPLWAAPATVAGFALHASQPTGLPLLLFSRGGPPALGAPRQRLELLGLDTRTGHAVLEETTLPAAGVEFGWTLRGDPDGRVIELKNAATGRGLVLEYTSDPLPPQTPHRAALPRRPAAPAPGGPLPDAADDAPDR